MKYIDIHTHMNFPQYDEDRDEVIARALDNNVWMVNVGTHIQTSREVVELAEAYPEGMYSVIGLHPIHAGRPREGEISETFNEAAFEALITREKVVAIGECGLDYFHGTQEDIPLQREAFERQIAFAETWKKPLMLHLRSGPRGDAYADALQMLKGRDLVGGNAHFFAGSEEDARTFLDMNFSLSFTGVVTFVPSYEDHVRFVPLDMIMAETDAPYVTPAPHRGKRNEPLYVRDIAHRIAEIRPEPNDEVLEALANNAVSRFSLEGR